MFRHCRPSLDGWTEPDLESLADEEDLIWEDADDCDLGDSDDLLDEEEFEEEKEEDYIVDYSDVPLGSTHGEDTMEMISLHPDDSLFDEELDNKELGPVRYSTIVVFIHSLTWHFLIDKVDTLEKIPYLVLSTGRW